MGDHEDGSTSQFLRSVNCYESGLVPDIVQSNMAPQSASCRRKTRKLHGVRAPSIQSADWYWNERRMRALVA